MKFLLYSIILLTLACGSGSGSSIGGNVEGTDAGNPILNGGPGPGAPVMGTDGQPGANGPNTLWGLVNTACVKLRDCYSGIVLEDCSTAVTALPASSSGWGINTDAYATIGDMIDAFTHGTLMLPMSQITTCSYDAGGLACASPAVQNAYNDADPGDFSNVGALFAETPSCANLNPPNNDSTVGGTDILSGNELLDPL